MTLLAKLALLIVFFLIGLGRRIDLGILLLLCTLLVEVLFPTPPGEYALRTLGSVLAPETLVLSAIVLVTVYLGAVLRATGALREMTASLDALIPDYRIVIAIPPALIGLIPMPAGALVSAPLVQEASGDRPISSEARTFINYWFRHLWEYVWPLYPGLLIGAAVLDLPVRRLAAAQYPLTIVALAVGLAFLFTRLPRERRPPPNPRGRAAALRGLARSTWPFATIVAGVFLLRAPILAALAITTLLAAALSRLSLRRHSALLRESVSARTLLLVVAVMSFKSGLDASGAMDEIPGILDAAGVPDLVPLFAAPFLVGLLTGVNQAYVAITFPILRPLLGDSSPDMARVMFAYVSGFLGILLSPTHLCLVMTREYFRAEFAGVYRLLAAPVAVLFLASIGLLLTSR